MTAWHPVPVPHIPTARRGRRNCVDGRPVTIIDEDDDGYDYIFDDDPRRILHWVRRGNVRCTVVNFDLC